MRNLSLASAISLIVGLAIVGCKGSSGVDHPQKPTLVTSTNALTFGEVFGSGTFVGVQALDSFQITNNGLEDLTIGTLTVTGDSAAYTVQGPNDANQQPQTTVKGAQSVYVQVLFQPTQLRQYAGTLTITSNADNAPSKTLGLFGCGVSAGQDAGVAYCTFDAGF